MEDDIKAAVRDVKQELLTIYATVPFNRDPIKEIILVDDQTLYLVMFNGPDLLFHFAKAMVK